MNGLDIAIAISLIFGFFIGWKLRAVTLIGFTLSLSIAIWCANHLYLNYADFFKDMPDAARHSFAWIAVFLFFLIALLLLFSMISRSFEASHLQWLDHLLGAVMATVLTLILLVFILYIINGRSPQHRSRLIQHSTFAPPLLHYSDPWLRQFFDKFPKFKQTLQ